MATMTTTKSLTTLLPPELLDLIFSFLPSPSLGHLRLTSKTLAQLGARHLVQNLHLMFTHHSFQNLLHISQHPVLHKHVTTLTYEVRFLEEVDLAEFTANIIDISSTLPQPHHPSDAHISRAWEAYKPLLDQQ